MAQPFKAREDFTCVFRSCPSGGKGFIDENAVWNRSVSGQRAHYACYMANGEKFSPELLDLGRVPTPTPNPMPAPNGNSGNLAAAIAAAIQPLLDASIDETQVRSICNTAISEALASFDGGVSDDKLKSMIQLHAVKRVECVLPDGTVTVTDMAHKNFPRLVWYATHKANDRRNFYLYGPPGSFKSTAAKQLARQLGRAYGVIALNLQTSDTRLLGYKDANGVYHATEFRQRYEHGGVFCIDELDNASANLLTALNGAFENGHCAFPDGIVARHPDFVLVCTGNTSCRGMDPLYPERRVQDGAFMARFTFLDWAYDEQLERTIALGIHPDAAPIVDWIQDVRQFCKTNYPKLIVSPRETFRIVEDLRFDELPLEDILQDELWHGFDKDSVARIVANHPLPARKAAA